MTINSTLSTIAKLIDTESGGRHSQLRCDELMLETQIKLANSLNHKPIRVLSKWKRFKVDTDKRKEQMLRQLQPSICSTGIYLVYSSNVLSDNTGQVPEGGWI